MGVHSRARSHAGVGVHAVSADAHIDIYPYTNVRTYIQCPPVTWALLYPNRHHDFQAQGLKSQFCVTVFKKMSLISKLAVRG